MKDEYDFTNGERGGFFRDEAALVPPVHLLRAADHRAMPWKNGGGVTREVAVHPPGAGIADFQWRLSFATVSAGGPFSAFPGIDRVLMVISGELTLVRSAGETVTLCPESPPFAFQGESPIGARDPEAPVTDFNVMVRRDVFSAHVERVSLVEPMDLAPGAVAFVVALTGGAVVHHGVGLALEPRDTLRIDAGPEGGSLPRGVRGRFILVTLAPTQGAVSP